MELYCYFILLFCRWDVDRCSDFMILFVGDMRNSIVTSCYHFEEQV